MLELLGKWYVMISMNLIQQIEHEEINRLKGSKYLPQSGDKVSIHYAVKGTDRVQIFTGTCLSVKRRGISSSCRIYTKTGNDYIIRYVPIYSPRVQKIEVLTSGYVRRKNINYIIGLSTKKARIRAKYNTNNSNTTAIS